MARIASEADAKWKPAPSDRFPSGAWSILEICCHMLYEETEDFRTRLRLTQEDPAAPWPGWDPEGHAVRERYNEQSLPVVLDAWVRERKSRAMISCGLMRSPARKPFISRVPITLSSQSGMPTGP